MTTDASLTPPSGPTPRTSRRRRPPVWAIAVWVVTTAGAIVVFAAMWGHLGERTEPPTPAADAPERHFRILDRDSVYDTKTHLTWQRTVPNRLFRWREAIDYCARGVGLPGQGWRLPSAKEMETIVNESRELPAVDARAFPDTPFDRAYWSSSHLAAYDEVPFTGSLQAFAVSFDFGTIDEAPVEGDDSWLGDPPFHRLHVRCVR